MRIIKKYQWLLLSILFTAALISIRMVRTDSLHFLSIEWNLFLAAIPLFVSHFLAKSKTRISGGLLFGLWLLFFPNAMYIITDLFHLSEGAPIPQWYDLLILFTAAVNGAVMGLISLQNAERYLDKIMPLKYVPFVVFGLFLLCGYGIYLGRYRYLNSWDIITRPRALAWGVIMNLRHPLRYEQVWMITGLFGTWLYIVYAWFKKLKTTSGNNNPN
ncbi:MAG: DUF1361 domain-containing protein [Taibaiella sp.]|nr:DUF1361 domain-containing protein [Taibaiella sp.]